MTSRRRQIAGMLLIACACAAFAACGTTTANAPTPAPTVAGASEAPSPSPTLRPGEIEALPLDSLSTGAAEIARGFGKNVGVAVYVPSEQRIYQYNAEPEFPIASVIKVPIMLTVMDRAVQKGEAISASDSALIEEMITESDNDATTALWNEIGGAPAVDAFLAKAGVTGVTVDKKDWGDSTMSAAAGARLMAKLVNGDILDAPHRDYALQLLTSVDPVQDWGAVVAGTLDGQAGVKNGWYPEYAGWVVASVGYVIPTTGLIYTVAIFTDDWLYFSDGVQNVEFIGGLIHTAVEEE